MGRIVRLEVSDFKSYKGAQTIGPFRPFTAVIGPNGAGKSNLMDAISFVVGVQTKQLRGEQLLDLVYNADGRRDELQRDASVTLIYEPSPGELADVPEMAGETELSFQRSISRKGVSKYRLQGRTVLREDYDRRLKDIGVLVKARNFLVFQGDVENIASMSPTDLTKFFEEISSSAELIEEYERLKTKKDEAETDTIFTYRQKKGITQERKQAREQKAEADRFNNKRAELANLRTNHFLMQLLQVERGIEETRAAIKRLDTDLGNIKHRANEAETRIEQQRREEAKAAKAAGLAEKEVRKHRATVGALEPAVMKATEAAAFLRRKVTVDEKALQVAEADQQEQGEELVKLHEDLDKLRTAKEALEKHLEDAAGQSTLSRSQLEDLERVREEARAENAALAADIDSHQRAFDISSEQYAAQRNNADGIRQRRAALEQEATELQTRKEKLGKAIQQFRQDLNDNKARHAEAQSRFDDLQRERTELENELHSANAKLHQAKANRAESQKERRAAEFLGDLKRHFPGVKGRMVDLCTPSSRRYDLAISVAFGRQSDAIVVDKESTGLDCMKFMRDKRIGVATFLPLDSIEPKRVQESHRQLGSRFKLAIDVLDFDPALERAVQYVLAGVVICESLEDARELCFGRKARVKAVTLDGHIISTNGDMTGGTAGGSRGTQNRFEQKEIDNARRARDELRQRLDTLDDELFRLGGHEAAGPGSRRAHQSASALRRREQLGGGELQALRMAVTNAETRLSFAEVELRTTGEKLERLRGQAAAAEKSLAAIEPDLERLRAVVRERKESLEELQGRAKNLIDERIDEFGRTNGIPDIRAAEEAAVSLKNSISDKIRKVENQVTRTESQIKYIESRKLSEVVARARQKLKTSRASLVAKEKEVAEQGSKVEEARAQLEAAEEEFRNKRRAAKDRQVEAREAGKALEQIVLEEAQATKKITAHENDAEKLRAKRHEILQKAELDQVHIPLKSSAKRPAGGRAGARAGKRRKGQGASGEPGGESTSDSEESNSDSGVGAAMEGVEAASSSSDPLPSQPSDDPSSLGFSQSDSAYVQRDDKASAQVDFSALSEELTAGDQDATLKRFAVQIHTLEEELEKMQPNMKAEERFDDVSRRLKDTDEKLAMARQQSREVELSFEGIKQERYQKFMHMFDHVSSTIDTVYRELTKSARHPLGGNAYLSLDNTEEPYLGGIKYNAMPPTKRFRDMDQLSGGEKTVAALALLFAVHSYHPAPFFVMDECDAALDAANVHKVSSYIRRNSSNFQSVVISLKDTFFHRADALVGIYREQSVNSSQSVTLDLTPYGE